ncbi:MAG: ring-opening amidohydrolase [Rhizobiaceae bacterium]|nr:ring-opening amidohydrolase [Rhizobiaceae bacterium]
MRQAQLFRLSMSGPNDVSAIKELIETKKISASEIIAVMGKTEGNGCVNDFTRGFAVQSLQTLLRQYVSDTKLNSIGITISGGTEGGLSPHWLVFTAHTVEVPDNSQRRQKSLAFGTATTASIKPWELGRLPQVTAVSDAVQKAMERAGISESKDVHFVQIKCPLLTSDQTSQTYQGHTTVTQDTLKSMGFSRGASALGVALALGELNPNDVTDNDIGQNHSLYSAKASCSAGVELDYCEILVMGMSKDWIGDLHINHGVMRDAIDVEPLLSILSPLRSGSNFQLSKDEQKDVVAVLAKAEASISGDIRGQRHTMLNDSDISSTRHARGFTGGAIAAVIGHTSLFVSGGAEHQGPDGGGPVAAIYKMP